MKFQNTVKNGFYGSVRLTFLVGRILGFVPVGGLLNDTSEFTRFTWKTPYTLSLVIFLILNIISVVFRIYDNMLATFELRRIVELIYAAINLLSFVLLVYYCARFWNKALKKIESTEKTLPPLNVEPNRGKINKLMAFMFLCCTVHSLLFMIFTALSIMYCSLRDDDSGLYIKSYLLIMIDWYFNHMQFNYVLGILLWVSSHQLFFQWVFFDTLIMVLSMYLSKLFENFNQALTDKLKAVQVVSPNNVSWPEFQNYYNRLMQIVKIVDGLINPFILLSFAGNLIYIGQIMFYIFNKRHSRDLNSNCYVVHKGDWHRILFVVYTFVFALSRIVLISVLAAKLHSNSRLPLNYLHAMTAAAYDCKAQRFIDQVYHAKIGLSGLEFFIVTREMLLSTFATLITYELVLLQFKQ